MPTLPANFDALVRSLHPLPEGVEGYLSPREVRLLALFGACPTADGEALEIGSFKGRSTIVLAKATELAGDAALHAVDPLTSPSSTDPDLRGATSGRPEFEANLTRAGVVSRVRFTQDFSTNLAPRWTAPLRLLWIDGDHTLEGARADLEGFRAHLAEGAIVAFHDVLHPFDGPVRVFANLLEEPGWGAAGVCDSIGWAQRTSDPRAQAEHAATRRALARGLARITPLLESGRQPRGLARLQWRLLRALVPHGERRPEEILTMLVDGRTHRELRHSQPAR